MRILILSLILTPCLLVQAQEKKNEAEASKAGSKKTDANETVPGKADTEKVKAKNAKPKESLLDMMRRKISNATITLREPRFSLSIDDQSALLKLLPRVRTKIVDGELTLLESDGKTPLLSLKKLNITASAKSVDGGHEVTIEKGTVVERLKLTPELCDKGLKLITPLLADATDVEGEITLKIESAKLLVKSDKREIRELRGELLMHNVRATAGSTLADIVSVIGYVLRRDVPARMQVVKDSSVRFEVVDGRVYHEGLAFVLPELAQGMELRSSGSVGFDETLDLSLALTIPRTMLTKLPMLSAFADKPLEVWVRGTIDKPKVSLPDNTDLTDFIASRLAPTEDGKAESVPTAVARLIQGVADPTRLQAEKTEALPGVLFNLIRSIRDEQRRKIESGELQPRRRRQLPARLRRPPIRRRPLRRP